MRSAARTEAESAAADALRQKIAAAEALAGAQAASTSAAHRAEDAARGRAENAEILASYRRPLRVGWAAVALLVAIAGGAYVYLKEKPISSPPPAPLEAEAARAGDPLKLKLDYRLR